MITTCSAQHFKSLRSLRGLELGPITLLVGPNSAGKSTLLQAILLISQTLSSRVESQSVVLNGPLGRFGSFMDLLSSGSRSSTITLGFAIDGLTPVLAGPGELVTPPARSLFSSRGISCTIAFRRPATESSPELSDLRPQLHSCTLGSTATDFALGAQRIKLHIRRSRRTIEDRQAELGVTDVDEATAAALRYEINLQYVPPVDSPDDDQLVGCLLRHFLPSRLLFRYDAVASNARATATALCNFSVSTSAVMRTTARSIRPGETVPMAALDILKEQLEAGYPLLFETQVEPQQVLPPVDEVVSNESEPFGSVASPMSFGQWRENVSRTRGTERIRIRNVLQTLEDQIVAGIRQGRRPDYRLRLQRVPRDVLESLESLESYFTAAVRYLGPLRDEPKPLYPVSTSSDPTDVGLRGEYTAAVLNLNRDLRVRYVSSGHFRDFDGSVETEVVPLREAVVDWMRYLQVGNDVLVQDLEQYGHGVSVRIGSEGAFHDLTHVGVGVSQVLPIVVVCSLARPNGTLLLEQPELHLHPAVQSRLGDLFIATALRGVQLVIESHSEYIFSRFRLRSAMAATQRISELLRVYFVTSHRDTSKFVHVPLNDYGAVPAWPDGFFDQGQQEAEAILQAALAKRRAERQVNGGERHGGSNG